tara:strand:+ start:1474 stop:1626 length:153 start_codon:yes stop_codon:yes gene_type:complete
MTNKYKKEELKKQPMMKANLTEEQLNKYLKKIDKKKTLPKGIFETHKKKD